eukprot:365930-Chlamydomonas_euryale.AAC.36
MARRSVHNEVGCVIHTSSMSFALPTPGAHLWHAHVVCTSHTWSTPLARGPHLVRVVCTSGTWSTPPARGPQHPGRGVRGPDLLHASAWHAHALAALLLTARGTHARAQAVWSLRAVRMASSAASASWSYVTGYTAQDSGLLEVTCCAVTYAPRSVPHRCVGRGRHGGEGEGGKLGLAGETLQQVCVPCLKALRKLPAIHVWCAVVSGGRWNGVGPCEGQTAILRISLDVRAATHVLFAADVHLAGLCV